MLIIQLCTLYANFHTDLCALISPKLFGNSKKKEVKKWNNLTEKNKSKSAKKTWKYLLNKNGIHSSSPQIRMSNWIIEFAASAKF